MANPQISHQLYESLLNFYRSQNDKYIAELRIILEERVGVGDHTNIRDDIQRKIERIDHYQSLITTMEQLKPQKEQKENA